MYHLAYIALTNSDGKELVIPAADVKEVAEKSGGSHVTMRDGTTYTVQDVPSVILTAIDALWTEYTTALGDPA